MKLEFNADWELKFNCSGHFHKSDMDYADFSISFFVALIPSSLLK